MEPSYGTNITSSTVPLNPKHMANGIIWLEQTKRDLAQYMSGDLFNPTPSTLIQAINKGHFTSWSGLTTSLISKHLPNTIATAKGHLDQKIINLQRTKIANNLPVPPPSSTYDYINPPQYISDKPSGSIMCKIIKKDTLISKSYSDQTGHFPVQSSQGNE